MKILVRMPNWLGDMVMSTAFLNALRDMYPSAHIDLIVKKGLDVLLNYFPPHNERFIFSKDDYKGIMGSWRFGKNIRKQNKYDLFFCLPDSFSSAIMGLASGASKRIGFKKELRSILLTNAYQKKNRLHRVEEYIDLLNQFLQISVKPPIVKLVTENTQKRNAIIININSEAPSRRLPSKKAISIINAVRRTTDLELIFIGNNKEKEFVNDVFNQLENKTNCTNLSGTTSLHDLVNLFSTSTLLLTTDSGPAHLANALGTHVIILFGAGNESHTAPWNEKGRSIIRLGKLSCEPCENNMCKRYGVPECLLQLDEQIIAHRVALSLKST